MGGVLQCCTFIADSFGAPEIASDAVLFRVARGAIKACPLFPTSLGSNKFDTTTLLRAHLVRKPCIHKGTGKSGNWDGLSPQRDCCKPASQASSVLCMHLSVATPTLFYRSSYGPTYLQFWRSRKHMARRYLAVPPMHSWTPLAIEHSTRFDTVRGCRRFDSAWPKVNKWAI